MGKQKCEDAGPLSKKRMETIDEEFLVLAGLVFFLFLMLHLDDRNQED